MKKISASSIANVIAIFAVSVSFISLNKSCQSLEISEKQSRFNHKRQLLLSLERCKLTSVKMVYEMDNYLKKFPNDLGVLKLKLSIEREIPQMEEVAILIADKWDTYSIEEMRENQLGIEKFEMFTEHCHEKMNVMLKIDEQNQILDPTWTTPVLKAESDSQAGQD